MCCYLLYLFFFFFFFFFFVSARCQHSQNALPSKRSFVLTFHPLGVLHQLSKCEIAIYTYEQPIWKSQNSAKLDSFAIPA
jgi:hypothetical protein